MFFYIHDIGIITEDKFVHTKLLCIKLSKIQVIYAYCYCLGWFGRSNPDWRLYYFLEQHNIHVGESMILTRYTNFWLNIAEK